MRTSGAPVVVLIGGTDPFVRLGGHETFALAHAEAAVRAGFDTHLFYATSRTPPPGERRWTLHPVRSPVRPLRTLMASAHAPFLAPAIVRFIDATPGPVVIHALSAWACVAAAVARTLARRGRRVATVASAYTTLEHEIRSKLAGTTREHGATGRLRALVEYAWTLAVARHAEWRGFAAMDLVLVNYASVRALLGERLASSVEIRRVPYASFTAFSRAGAEPLVVTETPPGEAPLIVAVSRQDPRKGIDRLLHGLAALRASGVAFRACIVGTGPLLGAHRSLAAVLGLDDCTMLPGRVDDAFAYLRAADIFVLPSLEEGSGSLSLLEAMQAGCAVVATRIDGIPEDVADGENGLLVAPDDVAALRDALARLLDDPALRARLSAASRATFERRFAAAALVETVRALYAELAAAL